MTVKCGCYLHHADQFEIETEDAVSIGDADCLLPEAVEIIKELLMSSAWSSRDIDRRAEAFLEKARTKS